MGTNALTDFLAADPLGSSEGEFIFIDLTTAHTLVDILENRRNGERVMVSLRVAREMLDTVDDYLSTTTLDADVRRSVKKSRDDLQLRLSMLEQSFGGENCERKRG